MSFLKQAFPKARWNDTTTPPSVSNSLTPGNLRLVKILITNKIVSKANTWTYPYDDGNIYEVPTYEVVVSGRNTNGMEESKTFEAIRFGVTRNSADVASAPYTVGLAENQSHVIKRWLLNYKVHSAASVEDGAWQVYGNFLIHDGPNDKLNDLYASIGCIEICNGPHEFITFNNYIIALSGANGVTRSENLNLIGKSKKLGIEYEKAPRPPVVLI